MGVLLEKILKELGNTKNVISVNQQSEKLPKVIYSKKLPATDGFQASRIHTKKTLVMSANRNTYFIIEGYVTFKRYVKLTEKIEKHPYLIFFRKTVRTLISDEKEIISYLTNEKIDWKKDFDEVKLKTFYYFWKPTYLIIDSKENVEEITHKDFQNLKHSFLGYKSKIKRKYVKKKENIIKGKVSKLSNHDNKTN